MDVRHACLFLVLRQHAACALHADYPQFLEFFVMNIMVSGVLYGNY